MLPLRIAGPGEVAQPLTCGGCGAVYYGALLDPPASSVEAAFALPPPAGEARTALPSRTAERSGPSTPLSRELDRELTLAPPEPPRRDAPFARHCPPRGAQPYRAREVQRLLRGAAASGEAMESLLGSLAEGGAAAVDEARSLAEASLVEMVVDRDLFACLGIHPMPGRYPARHSWHASALAMALAVNRDWDHQAVMDLGFGVLVHDAGMLRVPEALLRQPAMLRGEEFFPIARHPLHTLDLLEERLESLPALTRTTAYQLHERCDGSGYPRGRTGDAIHESAKLAAVADVYVALVTPRPHRPGLLPYAAMEHLLYGVRSGLYDASAVRTLLQTVSLFPLGSFVELSDGRVGKVLRANGGDYRRPVVAARRRDAVQQEGEVLDLAAAPELEIVRPLAKV